MVEIKRQSSNFLKSIKQLIEELKNPEIASIIEKIVLFKMEINHCIIY